MSYFFKKTLRALSLFYFFSVGVVFADSKNFEDKILAMVNDSPITARQVETQASLILNQREQKIDPTDLKKQVLQQMIDQNLQAQIATAVGIQIPEEEVEEAISKITEEENLPLSELEKRLKTSGVSLEDFKKQLQTELLANHLQEKEVASKIHVTDEDLAQYLKTLNPEASYQYNVVDYYFPTAESSTEKKMGNAKDRVSKFYEHLSLNPKKIELPKEMIKKDLGWSTLENLPEAFATPLASMKPADIHKPMLLGNGFHILQLLAKRKVENVAENNLSLMADEKAQTEIKDIIFKQKFQKDLQTWLKEQRQMAYIKIYDQNLA